MSDLPKSSSKLVASDPAAQMVIRDVTPSITTFSVPFLRFGLIKVGGRGTVVKLRTGALAVFSPVALTPAVQSKLAALGNEVKYIAAPDIEHHIFLKPWSLAFPQAAVIGMEGLPEKREADPDTKGTSFAHVFSAANKRSLTISPEFDAEFDYEYVLAHQNKELVFLHKPTKTMIQADLIFNLPATEQYSRAGADASSGALTKLFGAIMNTRGSAIWQKRLIWYGSGSADRKGFADSVQLIKKWEFDRIIPCHGDVIETGGKGIFNKIFAWYMSDKL